MAERNREIQEKYPGSIYDGLDDPEPKKQAPKTQREFFLSLLKKAMEQPDDYNLESLRTFTLKRRLLTAGDFSDTNSIDNIQETREEIAV